MDAISQEVKDRDGNKIVFTVKGKVLLKLKKEKRQRKLGVIDRAKKIFVIKRKRHKHLHRKSNSYGFNHHILSKAKTFDKILLKDEYGEYQFPVSKVLEHGRNFMRFAQQGFELQIFFPIEIMELHRKTENTLSSI